MLKHSWLMILVAMLCCGPRTVAQAKGDAAAEKTAAATEKTTSIADKTKSMEKMAGYFNIYWDAKAGKLWLEIDKWGTEFLYQSSLPAGIGSNDIGLDRGQLGGTHVVRFERSGPKAAGRAAGRPADWRDGRRRRRLAALKIRARPLGWVRRL